MHPTTSSADVDPRPNYPSNCKKEFDNAQGFLHQREQACAQELLIDNTANNLANVNTTGFKRSHLEFADLIYDVSKQPGAPMSNGQAAPIGLQIGNGVAARGDDHVFTKVCQRIPGRKRTWPLWVRDSLK